MMIDILIGCITVFAVGIFLFVIISGIIWTIIDIENHSTHQTKKKRRKEMNTKRKSNPALDAAVAKKIAEHYSHTKEKHPYFADELLTLDGTAENFGRCLAYCRKELAEETEAECATAETILECELYEMKHAIALGDSVHAVEECYDAIAVILRIVDMLEGQESLGKPKKVRKENEHIN